MKTKYYSEESHEGNMERMRYWKLNSEGVFIYIFPKDRKAFFSYPPRVPQNDNGWYKIPKKQWFLKFTNESRAEETPRIFLKKFRKCFKQLTEKELFIAIL